MEDKVKSYSIEGVFALLAIILYTAVVIILLSLGIQSYKTMIEKDYASNETYLATSYIAAKIRSNDTKAAFATGGFVSAEADDGIPTLHIYQEIEGEFYETRVYYHEGYLKELFSFRDGEVAPEDGNQIMELSDLSFQKLSHGILVSIVSSEGQKSSTIVTMRSEGEVLDEGEQK
jgi:hypothetical protein